MNARMLLIGLAMLGWAVRTQADVVTYDAAADFSSVNNANGDWSYGFCTALEGPAGFEAFTNHRTWAGRDSKYAGIDAWDDGLSYDPSVTHNGSENSITAYGYTWAPGDLGLDSYNDCPVVRWTAPGAGSVDISATFTDISASSTLVYVFKNFSVVGLNVMSTASGVSWSGNDISVAKGDIIDFATSSSYGSVTKLDATIAFTAMPEPSTIIMSGISIIGLLAYAWRKRK